MTQSPNRRPFQPETRSDSDITFSPATTTALCRTAKFMERAMMQSLWARFMNRHRVGDSCRVCDGHMRPQCYRWRTGRNRPHSPPSRRWLGRDTRSRRFRPRHQGEAPTACGRPIARRRAVPPGCTATSGVIGPTSGRITGSYAGMTGITIRGRLNRSELILPVTGLTCGTITEMFSMTKITGVGRADDGGNVG